MIPDKFGSIRYECKVVNEHDNRMYSKTATSILLKEVPRVRI